MNFYQTNKLTAALATVALCGSAIAATVVSDDVIDEQRAALASSTEGAGFGPQSPRDIDTASGANSRVFQSAPAPTEMNLCNIHMHEGAEHKGGCLLYTSPSPRDATLSRMPSSA